MSRIVGEVFKCGVAGANGNDRLEGLIKTRQAGRCEIVEME
jgi:hypothetical protein